MRLECCAKAKGGAPGIRGARRHSQAASATQGTEPAIAAGWHQMGQPHRRRHRGWPRGRSQQEELLALRGWQKQPSPQPHGWLHRGWPYWRSQQEELLALQGWLLPSMCGTRFGTRCVTLFHGQKAAQSWPPEQQGLLEPRALLAPRGWQCQMDPYHTTWAQPPRPQAPGQHNFNNC